MLFIGKPKERSRMISNEIYLYRRKYDVPKHNFLYQTGRVFAMEHGMFFVDIGNRTRQSIPFREIVSGTPDFVSLS